MFDLGGKVAVVTGAGRGIGQAISEQLAKEGVRVALVARTESELLKVKEGITSGRGEAIAIPLDISRSGAASVIVDRVSETFGDIDILINNAAVPWPVGPTAICNIDEWVDAFQLNVFSSVRLALAVLPTLLQKGSGRIVNLSSGAARPPGGKGQNAYSTGKAALEMFSLNLGAEIDGSGVTINALRPGATDTPMQTWMQSQDPKKVGAGLAERFIEMKNLGIIKEPVVPARRIIELLRSEENGVVIELLRRSENGKIVDVENRFINLG